MELLEMIVFRPQTPRVSCFQLPHHYHECAKRMITYPLLETHEKAAYIPTCPVVQRTTAGWMQSKTGHGLRWRNPRRVLCISTLKKH